MRRSPGPPLYDDPVDPRLVKVVRRALVRRDVPQHSVDRDRWVEATSQAIAAEGDPSPGPASLEP